MAFGGNPTGRKSRFKFIAGTPEGDEERRFSDNERKKAARAVAAKLVEPPPLPGASALDQGAPLGDGVAADLPGSIAEMAGVPWDPQLLKPFVKEAVDGTEGLRVQKMKGLAEEARLPDKLVKMICDDSKYVPAFKNSIVLSAPNALAKLFNRTGISGQYSDEVICALSLAAIWMQGRRLEARLKQLIDEQKAAKEKPPAAKL